MSQSQLNEFRKLAGLPVQEQEAVSGLADITTSVKPEATPACEVPREITSALSKAEKAATVAGEEAAAKGQPQEAYFQNSYAAFVNELCTMMDGTTEGHKRAVQHMTSAMQSMVDKLPPEVIKYLAGNSSDWLNSDPINKEGIRKDLRSFWEDSKAEK